MVSPGKLRALTELQSGDHDAFEPEVDETGDVTYPAVEGRLDERDGKPVDFLEMMAERGVLSSEFEHKVYVCPSCSAEGMQYSTACPNCGSVHATREPRSVHAACGEPLGVDRDDEADDPGDGNETEEPEEASYCPTCEEEVGPDDREQDRPYRCRDCDSRFDSPTHRLWCRDCLRTYPPTDAREHPLYRYPLTAFGARWVTEQLEGRRSLAETFEARGYETSVDASVSTASGDELPVHVYAEDELLDDRIVADVHESPLADDVDRLDEAAREVDARAILLLTNGSVGERAAALVEKHDLTVVSAADGSLSREYGVDDREHGGSRVLEWFESLFSPPAAKR